MRVLSLDTTTRAGSVALVDDDRIVEERPGDPSRTHAERLPAEVLALLAAHGLAPADIDLFAVAAGPGSFTGLRIGIATVQGFAFVHRRRVVAVSALDALGHIAARTAPTGSSIAVWMDAQRRDVFAALYEVGSASLFEAERLIVREPASVDPPAAVLARWRGRVPPGTIFIGDGATAFAGDIAGAVERAVVVAPPALAGVIGLLAVRQAARGGAVDPAEVRPLYVRRPDAEVDREKRAPEQDETQRTVL